MTHKTELTAVTTVDNPNLHHRRFDWRLQKCCTNPCPSLTATYTPTKGSRWIGIKLHDAQLVRNTSSRGTLINWKETAFPFFCSAELSLATVQGWESKGCASNTSECLLGFNRMSTLKCAEHKTQWRPTLPYLLPCNHTKLNTVKLGRVMGKKCTLTKEFKKN